MLIKKYHLLGPFYLIRKRQYGKSIIALLFQFTIPLQLMLILHWPLYWPVIKNICQTLQQHQLTINDLYILFLSPYYALLTAPGSLLLSILLTRFLWGYWGHHYYGNYEQQLQHQGPHMLADDHISSYLAAVGYVLAFLKLFFAGVPYEHAFYPHQVNDPYPYEEAILQLDSQIWGSLKILCVTLAYLFIRMFIKNTFQTKSSMLL